MSTPSGACPRWVTDPSRVPVPLVPLWRADRRWRVRRGQATLAQAMSGRRLIPPIWVNSACPLGATGDEWFTGSVERACSEFGIGGNSENG